METPPTPASDPLQPRLGLPKWVPRFQVVLHGVVNMQLQNQRLWDVVDDLVYQFQSSFQHRAKMKTKTDQNGACMAMRLPFRKPYH
ncbi:hypothetical protein PVL29_021323 [Vitis rotundifolia]|uniref:Uncharacterized protein n=1 Tax=Vitis rotundifolia TaxID=103349 RepID=A0AA38YZ41_VITRO|nr:hypothetical protein PVL29_021323 [Vitis rotundifolia]